MGMDCDLLIHLISNIEFSNSRIGQACTAGSRIYVQEGIYDLFLQGFTQVAEALTKATGGPFEQGVQHGPQVSSTQLDVSRVSIALPLPAVQGN